MGKHLLGSKKNGQSFMKHLENVQKKQRSVSLINTVVSFFCCHSVGFFLVIQNVLLLCYCFCCLFFKFSFSRGLIRVSLNFPRYVPIYTPT